ncbi:MAG: hypothetical protein A2017_05790 [Lentisphaerae bacterium GWF2_44_16]|nr:MAG: hypothetical protein A2017_05790 [Lentisphaerae bacterium GWF2_44_16]
MKPVKLSFDTLAFRIAAENIAAGIAGKKIFIVIVIEGIGKLSLLPGRKAAQYKVKTLHAYFSNQPPVVSPGKEKTESDNKKQCQLYKKLFHRFTGKSFFNIKTVNAFDFQDNGLKYIAFQNLTNKTNGDETNVSNTRGNKK